MEQQVQKSAELHWIDVINPTKEALDQFAKEFKLAKRVLYNCLDPDYLPHVESHGETHFILLRFMEPGTPSQSDSVQELTTKVALFVKDKTVLTIHRLPLKEISEVQKKLKSVAENELDRSWLLGHILEQVSLGFDDPMNELEKKVESFEIKVLQNLKQTQLLLEGYYIKRKANAFKKVIKLTLDTHSKLNVKLGCSNSNMSEAKERLDRNLFYAEAAHENIQSLLNTQLALQAQKTNEASYRTNEIMRILTVFSLFFLPLNFIAGLFGMNFENMPLLKYEWGFWISIFMMLTFIFGLAIYVLKKGWLQDRPQLTDHKDNLI